MSHWTADCLRMASSKAETFANSFGYSYRGCELSWNQSLDLVAVWRGLGTVPVTGMGGRVSRSV